MPLTFQRCAVVFACGVFSGIYIQHNCLKLLCNGLELCPRFTHPSFTQARVRVAPKCNNPPRTIDAAAAVRRQCATLSYGKRWSIRRHASDAALVLFAFRGRISTTPRRVRARGLPVAVVSQVLFRGSPCSLFFGSRRALSVDPEGAGKSIRSFANIAVGHAQRHPEGIPSA